MITLLLGDNSFELEQALARISSEFDGTAEKINSSELQLAQLPDILMGVSLFATARLIIIRNLSENKSIWAVFGDWLPRISDDINLVLIESKPDKRTATFKVLKDQANIKEFQPWNDRDTAKAEKWVIDRSKVLGFDIDAKNARILVERVGVDQWRLSHALEKLSLADTISPEVIKDIIEASPAENVFELFEIALKRDVKNLKRTLNILKQTEDVYRLSALLFTQAFQLAAVWSATRSDNVSKDFGIHPYVASKLALIAKRLSKSDVVKIISTFAEADDDMKTSRAEPWLLIELALIKIANI
jgi:DNA polymerase III delta subunit